jgi:uncharacterized membrane protein
MRDLFLFIHFIGLAMAVGTGFANLFLASAASKLEPAERGSFMAKTTILVRMGHTGLGLLILSGFYLINSYWNVLSEMPMLIAKLAFVALQIIMVTALSLIIRKAKRENNPSLLLKLRPFRLINFFIGITIVILAVMTFH